ncbi:insulinase family protein [Candidatus Parcubacteria bacterium]|nr:MAG: insulinase family protein [Candidatus Parcubacteria bacterium]
MPTKNSITLPSILTLPLRGTKTVTILVMVGTGSKFETRPINGLSHFLEHLLFKGTKKRPSAMLLVSELDSLGAEFNAFTSKEYTGFWIKTKADKLAKATDILADMLLNPLLKNEEIERERGVILEELNMYQDNPMLNIDDVFEECLYGNTPAGWDTIGRKDSLLQLKRKDFLAYLDSQYGPNNTIIVISGAVSSSQAKKIAAKYFFKKQFLSRGKNLRAKLPVREHQTAPQIHLKIKKTDQAHLALGVRTMPYFSSNRFHLKLLALILGGTMSSRLFIKLRERRGLAYYVKTMAEFYSDSGYLVTQAGVSPNKLNQAIKTIWQEYQNIKTKGVSAVELKRAKEILAGKLAIQLESSDMLASWYGRQAVMQKIIAREGNGKIPIYTPEDYLKAVEKITPQELKQLARQIFTPARLNLAIIGTANKTELKNILKRV